MLPIINPVPIIFTLSTMFGILVHDLHIDRATTVAVALPALIASAGALDKVINSNYHTHVERASLPKFSKSFRSTLPNVQPPRDDDRRYIQNKKAHLGFGTDHTYLWPSV